MKHLILVVGLIGVAILIVPDTAFAACPVPPVCTPFERLLDVLTGKVALSIITLAILISGFAIALGGQYAHGLQMLINVVFGGAVALGSVSLVTYLFHGSGALI